MPPLPTYENRGTQPPLTIKSARLLTFASWGFYPIVYMAPYANISGPDAETTIQLGYTLADLIAKAVVGILIYNIAVRKSALETA